MGLFDWWKRSEQQLDAGTVSEALIREATDYVVKMTNPRLTLVGRFRERLAPAVEAGIEHLRRVAATLPVPREASAASWASDPSIHAFFAVADDVPRLFSRSQEVQAFFARESTASEVYAVLGMALLRQKGLGMAMQGDVMRRDVPQTTYSFTDHKMRVLAASEPQLRREIGRRVLDQLALQVLARAGETQSRRQSLEHERALLRTRLRILQQQDAGLASMAGSGDAGREQDLPEVETRLEENERALAEIGVGADALEQELDDLVDVLSNPGREIEFASHRVLLTPMNVLVEGEVTEPGREVEFHTVQLAGNPASGRAFTLVRFARADLRAGGLRLDEADRFLG
jgi:hypothetical protein